MKNRSIVQPQPTVAAPLASNKISMPSTFVVSAEAASENDKRMLLFRLSEAGMRIREESELIRRTGFTDPASRLMRILAEAIEEQRTALGDRK